ncbi:hypothetical protein FGO68_gene16487 [Halteria grandinella]|uniref:DNA-directed RNA polymerase subunit P n=1 Tax=Halteria grandinella TaxID=5974 RepID=A0A8J8NQ05_HALGN|nr:hypothetical protein FGO68_gene16487 [Halteria grandinella]
MEINTSQPAQHEANLDERFDELQLGKEGQVAEYICGSCGKNAKIDKDAGIRCQHCGYRIFYKKRERKMLQYNAR